MRVERTLKIRNQAVGQVCDIMNAAERLGLNHLEIARRVSKVVNEFMAKTPQWAKEYVRGYAACRKARIEREMIEFCYIHKDGKRYSIRKDSPLYYEKHGLSPKELHDGAVANNHYWIHNGNPYGGSTNANK